MIYCLLSKYVPKQLRQRKTQTAHRNLKICKYHMNQKLITMLKFFFINLGGNLLSTAANKQHKYKLPPGFESSSHKKMKYYIKFHIVFHLILLYQFIPLETENYNSRSSFRSKLIECMFNLGKLNHEMDNTRSHFSMI